MHFPESICESTTTGQAISTDQSSKKTEKKKSRQQLRNRVLPHEKENKKGVNLYEFQNKILLKTIFCSPQKVKYFEIEINFASYL